MLARCTARLHPDKSPIPGHTKARARELRGKVYTCAPRRELCRDPRSDRIKAHPPGNQRRNLSIVPSTYVSLRLRLLGPLAGSLPFRPLIHSSPACGGFSRANTASETFQYHVIRCTHSKFISTASAPGLMVQRELLNNDIFISAAFAEPYFYYISRNPERSDKLMRSVFDLFVDNNTTYLER